MAFLCNLHDFTGAFDADTLPVLVAYRSGSLVASIVKVADHFGGGSVSSSVAGSVLFGVEEVEWLLSERGLLGQFVDGGAESSSRSRSAGVHHGHTDGSSSAQGPSEFVLATSREEDEPASWVKSRFCESERAGGTSSDDESCDDDLGVD
jgi:hypothetical protein